MDLVFKIENKFNQKYFDECFSASLPYIKDNLNLDDWGFDIEKIKLWMQMSYMQAAVASNCVLFSVKSEDRIMAYMCGPIDKELNSLLLEFVMYNTDENGSRSWIYEHFYPSPGIYEMLAPLGLKRWHIKVFAENGDKTSQISAVPDGDPTGPYGNRTRNYRLFKSPYGWEE